MSFIAFFTSVFQKLMFKKKDFQILVFQVSSGVPVRAGPRGLQRVPPQAGHLPRLQAAAR